MPFWFVQLAILAVLGLIGAYSSAFVASSIMFTNGLMIPVWILAVNLWWIALALAPWAWLARRGYPVRGFLTSALVLTAIFTLPTIYIAQKRAAVVPATENTANLTPLPEFGIRSLEMVMTDDISHLHSCEILCQRLLTGGDVQWIRMASANDAVLPQRVIVYYRATSEDCASLDYNFPNGAECLLARADDGTRADLRLHVTELGDFRSPLEQNAGIVALTGVQELVITDLRDGRQLVRQSRYGWTEPMVGFLEPDIDIDVAVRAHGGFRLRPKRQYTGKIEIWKSLNSIGVRTNLARNTQPVYSPEKFLWQHGAILTSLPYDAPLLTTTFAVAGGKPAPTRPSAEAALKNMLDGVETTPVAVVDPNSILGSVDDKKIQSADQRILTVPTASTPINHLADDDLAGMLAQIGKLKGLDALRAVNIVANILRAAPSGTYDADSDTYLAALEKTPGLIRFVGNFDFDPTPHLRDIWTAGVDEAADARVLRAVCSADARWSRHLVPFVLEAGQSLLPRYRAPKFFGAELEEVVIILGHLNRSDLARAFVDQIDWAIVDGLSSMAKFGTFPEVTRDLLITRATYLTRCRDYL